MFGLVIAFQDYNIFQGIRDSSWVGIEHFTMFLNDSYFWKLVKNTVLLAFFNLLFVFPIPIIFSLFLNEVRIGAVKKFVQTISFFPYFISSAVIVTILYRLLSPQGGLVNQGLNWFGLDSIFFMADPDWFRPLYITLNVWQMFGYSTIIYLAAITSIDPHLYEAADMDGANRKISLFDVVNMTFLILVAILCIYPFVYILGISLSDGKQVVSGSVVLFPKGFNIETYKYILGNPRLGVTTGLLNSFFYTVIGGAIAVLVTYMTAYPLSRKRLIGRYVIMLLFLFTWVFEAGIIPNYIVYNSLDLINSRLVMLLPMAVNTFLLIITKSFLDALPHELEEAAVIDGANDWQIMWRVFFPLSKPIIATISVFNAVFIWNQFLIPMIYLQDRNLQPITVILYNMIINSGKLGTTMETMTVNGVQLLPQNLQAASIFCAVVPILFIYPFAQKYFTKGMLLGSVKG